MKYIHLINISVHFNIKMKAMTVSSNFTSFIILLNLIAFIKKLRNQRINHERG